MTSSSLPLQNLSFCSSIIENAFPFPCNLAISCHSPFLSLCQFLQEASEKDRLPCVTRDLRAPPLETSYAQPLPLFSLQSIAGPALTTPFLYFLHCLICSEISFAFFFFLFSLQFSMQGLPGTLFIGKSSEGIPEFIHILLIFMNWQINFLIFIFCSSHIIGFQHL